MKNNNPLYPAMFTPLEDGGFEVSFRDIPEANVEGISFVDAVERAEEQLLIVKNMFDEDHTVLPEPTRPLSGEVMIELKLETEEEASV